MQLAHLETFLALAEDGSLARTAGRLGHAPGRVCSTMTALEAALGLRLFVRTIDRFELTVAGRALLTRADDAVEALHRLADEAEDRRGTL